MSEEEITSGNGDMADFTFNKIILWVGHSAPHG